MQNSSLQSNRTVTIIVTAVLWFVTAAVGLWQIALGREILVGIFARLTETPEGGYEAFKQAQLAGSLGIILIMILAIVWIAVFIGGAEYHYKHLGEPSSWRLFAWTIAVEVAIFILAWWL